jgi:hypothetical protein
MPRTPRSRLAALACLISGAAGAAPAHAALCQAQSGAQLTPVIELYTSEGCSSCPPADRWLSGLKGAAAEGKVVAQAFHVGYWDYIGWVDRFAAPAHTVRQREIAAANGLRSIYTPQLVRNGRDSRDYASALGSRAGTARAGIAVRQTQADAFEAAVTPADGSAAWSAYWTVTEHGHSSKVKSGENAGELLQHDFVVRQYVPAGRYRGAQNLRLRAVQGTPGHARQVNLVVVDAADGSPWQALSLACSRDGT